MSVSIIPAVTGTPPIVGKLITLFEALPDGDLIESLVGPVRRGPKGYSAQVLWRCCDAAYSSQAIRHAIKQHYWAEPVIDPNPSHKSATAKTIKTPEWKKVFARRTAVERLNGRLKGFYKLNDVRVRGHIKVRVHALLSAIVLLGQAISCPEAPRRRLCP